jgi:hypothetical protein
MESLEGLSIVCERINLLGKERDLLIFNLFRSGHRQKVIAKCCGLSESRVKKICNEQKKKLSGSP